MKSLSNTVIAAIFAVVLTALVALSLKVSFFETKEAQTRDQMMVLRYRLQHKSKPPDASLVFAGIDGISLKMVGAWPFRRNVHGEFLQVIAPLKPKVVGWDIFFVDAHQPDQNAAMTATPDASGTAPASTTPAPDATAPPPTSTPAPTPPATSAPATVPATNSPPAAPGSPSTSYRPASAAPPMYIGADPTASGSSAPPVTTAPANPPADNSSTSPAPAASTPAPADPKAAAPASATTPASATADASQAQGQNLSEGEMEDLSLVQGASLLPRVVTAADRSETGDAYTDKDFLPTRPITHITGDINQLLSANSAELPFPALRKVSYFGMADADGDSGGGVHRTMPLIVNINGYALPSLSLQILMQYWGVDPDKVVVDLGHEVSLPRPDGTIANIPIDAKGQLIISYRAHVDDYLGMSYAQMINAMADKEGLMDKPTDADNFLRDHLPPIQDKIIIVGVTITGTDAGPTPIDSVSPLVNSQLNALNTILQEDYLYPVTGWVWIPIYGLLLFGAANLMLRVSVVKMIPIAIGMMIFIALASFGAFYFAHRQAPLVMPEIGFLLLSILVPSKGFFGEEREKQRVKAAMGAYLSEKVMNKILSHPDGVKLGGTKEVITIMFCDIRGFTAYCDNRDPQEVLNVVNEYFEEMTKVVFKYEGTVDKYIGDCIMAFWNMPEKQPDHAQLAVCCAMEMRYALANFKAKRAGKDTELFECGIGIHTGEALVGNMGSSLKVNYTAMGSTVNLGARLEALTKRLNERILISQETKDLLTGDFPLTDRGEAMVPGFVKPIHVYAVGADQDITSALKVGRTIATQQDYTAEEVTAPIWKPAPLPTDADPNP